MTIDDIKQLEHPENCIHYIHYIHTCTHIFIYIYIFMYIYIYCSQHFFLLCLGASLCNSGLLVGSKLSKQNETSLSGDAMASNEISFWPISPESSLANVNDLYVLSGPDIVSNIAIRTNPKRNEEFQKTQCHHCTRHKQLRIQRTPRPRKSMSAPLLLASEAVSLNFWVLV